MAKGRRNRISNRRLPTLRQSSTRKYNPLDTLKRLLGPGTVYGPETEPYKAARKAFAPPQKRHLAKQKSTFPRTYSTTTWTAGYDPAIKEPDSVLKAELPICTKRAQRSEVMHATGKAGKRGQKTPKWTTKSKIRC